MLPEVVVREALAAGLIGGFVIAGLGYWMEGFLGLPRFDMSQAGMKYLGRAQPDNMTWAVGMGAHLGVAASLGLLYAAAFYPNMPFADPTWWHGILYGLAYGVGVMIFLPVFIRGTQTRFRLLTEPRDILGSLVLHLAYGAVLGAIYFPFG